MKIKEQYTLDEVVEILDDYDMDVRMDVNKDIEKLIGEGLLSEWLKKAVNEAVNVKNYRTGHLTDVYKMILDRRKEKDNDK